MTALRVHENVSFDVGAWPVHVRAACLSMTGQPGVISATSISEPASNLSPGEASYRLAMAAQIATEYGLDARGDYVRGYLTVRVSQPSGSTPEAAMGRLTFWVTQLLRRARRDFYVARREH